MTVVKRNALVCKEHCNCGYMKFLFNQTSVPELLPVVLMLVK